MSRVEKYRNKKTKRGQTEQETGATVQGMPSRKSKYPSSRNKMTQLFYRLLIVLFVALVAVLLFYGKNALDQVT
ncbi:hypothetical protein [Paenibacillus daejeonensis]|uniref:hypothetical protein n=1 Tax=Paenibacillus daejeonensis TaxID=135193 RepID=UPI00035D6326|nr:hypothetical protein [Paenibacillus daejeonensis]